MLDTVRACGSGKVREVPSGSGWQMILTDTTKCVRDQRLSDPRDLRSGWLQYEGTHAGGMLVHEATGLRVGLSGGCAGWVEVSLPRLIFEHNGFCIGSQDQLDSAIARMRELVAEVVEDFRIDKWTRLDLVLQFEGNPGDWIRFHRFAKHPRIRKAPAEWREETLIFPGKSFRLRIYDKMFEMCRKHGRVVRVEIQMRSAAIREVIGENRDLSFDRLYAVYREWLMEFHPAGLPDVANIYEFVAFLESIGFAYQGVSALELVTKGKSKASRCRWRKRVQSEVFSVAGFNWGEKLPVGGPARLVAAFPIKAPVQPKSCAYCKHSPLIEQKDRMKCPRCRALAVRFGKDVWYWTENEWLRKVREEHQQRDSRFESEGEWA